MHVKVNLHMCKYTPRVNIHLLRPGVYMYLLLHICILYIKLLGLLLLNIGWFVLFLYMYFRSCERAANIHSYANVSFPLISIKLAEGQTRHLKLDLYDKTTNKYTKDKNLAWNQYSLFDSLSFNHSNCGSPFVKTLPTNNHC